MKFEKSQLQQVQLEVLEDETWKCQGTILIPLTKEVAVNLGRFLVLMLQVRHAPSMSHMCVPFSYTCSWQKGVQVHIASLSLPTSPGRDLAQASS